MREEMAAIIQGLSRASLTDVECSQRLYRILCALLLPQQAVCGDSGPAARAVQYIARHLFEPLSVTQVAAAESAGRRVSEMLLAEHMRTCVVEEVRAGNDEVID